MVKPGDGDKTDITGASGRPKPMVSVVVPVWDGYVDTFFAEPLRSLQAQDVEAEIILVDNASLVAVSADAPVVTVRSEQRVTCGAARNLGLQCVTTPFVAMWDADDVMLPGTLGTLCHDLESRDDVVATGMAIMETSRRRHRWPRRFIAKLTVAPRLFALLGSVWAQYPTTGATVMRTDVVRAAGGYLDADAAEDWALGVALLWRGKVGWSERPGRLYRRHTRSQWSRNSTTRDLLGHARAVRSLLGRDPAVPPWCKAALPLIQLAHYAAILGVRPVIHVVRRLAGEPPVPPWPVSLSDPALL